MRLPVCDNSERGLLAVALDPKFGTEGNDCVYLYYTHKGSVCPDKQPTRATRTAGSRGSR